MISFSMRFFTLALLVFLSCIPRHLTFLQLSPGEYDDESLARDQSTAGEIRAGEGSLGDVSMISRRSAIEDEALNLIKTESKKKKKSKSKRQRTKKQHNKKKRKKNGKRRLEEGYFNTKVSTGGHYLRRPVAVQDSPITMTEDVREGGAVHSQLSSAAQLRHGQAAENGPQTNDMLSIASESLMTNEDASVGTFGSDVQHGRISDGILNAIETAGKKKKKKKKNNKNKKKNNNKKKKKRKSNRRLITRSGKVSFYLRLQKIIVIFEHPLVRRRSTS